jgi:hypothetical protein
MLRLLIRLSRSMRFETMLRVLVDMQLIAVHQLMLDAKRGWDAGRLCGHHRQTKRFRVRQSAMEPGLDGETRHDSARLAGPENNSVEADSPIHIPYRRALRNRDADPCCGEVSAR